MHPIVEFSADVSILKITTPDPPFPDAPHPEPHPPPPPDPVPFIPHICCMHPSSDAPHPPLPLPPIIGPRAPSRLLYPAPPSPYEMAVPVMLMYLPYPPTGEPGGQFVWSAPPPPPAHLAPYFHLPPHPSVPCPGTPLPPEVTVSG